MGNTESAPSNNDRPGPLAIEATLLIDRGFHAGAVLKYRRSYDLYKEAGTLALAGRSLRLAIEAGLMMPNPDYELAATAFEEVGTLYLSNEISALMVSEAFANSIFCLLAAGRIATAKGKLTDYGTKDTRFTINSPGIAAACILNSYAAGNRSHLSERVESYKDISVLPEWKVTLLEKIVERL